MTPSQIAARWHLSEAMGRYRFENDAQDAFTAEICRIFDRYTHNTIPTPEDTDQDIAQYEDEQARRDRTDSYMEGADDLHEEY